MENERGRLALAQEDLFLFFKKRYVGLEQVVSTLLLIYFGRARLRHTIKTNFKTFQTVDQEVCSNLIFYEKVWDKLLQQILCMIFK